jgi:CheY-like chemotaxis protein
MSEIRILVAEDNERWQEAISNALKSLSDDVHAVVGYEEAVQEIRENRYDLVIVDLSLSSGGADSLGMDLLSELRRSTDNQHCAVIVLTGYANTERVQRAKNEYDVFRVIDKGDSPILDDSFAAIARSAIRTARIKKAAAEDSTRFHLTVTFSHSHLVKSEITGPNRREISDSTRQQNFDVADLARRADLLNWMIEEGGAAVWREEARSIGNATYNALTADRDVLGNLKAARALARGQGDVWLQFSGPSVGLGTPFELMRDEVGEPVVLTHILTRQITPLAARKSEAFHDFINELLKNGESLHMLIVGANSDGRIPAAEEEAVRLKWLIEANLYLLGIRHSVKLLTGTEADYKNVKQALREGNYHIFHYCGHGYYDDSLAEHSGLVLRDSHGVRTLTASELHSSAKDKRLRLVFLSACTSARTADRAGRGDFHSVFESLAKADVPIIIGYRWSVKDRQAMRLAEVFYSELWRTLSPGEAMLSARLDAAREWGLDDDTWASPVVLMQNA